MDFLKTHTLCLCHFLLEERQCTYKFYFYSYRAVLRHTELLQMYSCRTLIRQLTFSSFSLFFVIFNTFFIFCVYLLFPYFISSLFLCMSSFLISTFFVLFLCHLFLPYSLLSFNLSFFFRSPPFFGLSHQAQKRISQYLPVISGGIQNPFVGVFAS